MIVEITTTVISRVDTETLDVLFEANIEVDHPELLEDTVLYGAVTEGYKKLVSVLPKPEPPYDLPDPRSAAHQQEVDWDDPATYENTPVEPGDPGPYIALHTASPRED